MRRESNAEKIDQDNNDADKSKGETSGDKKVHKSILRTTSKASTVGKFRIFLFHFIVPSIETFLHFYCIYSTSVTCYTKQDETVKKIGKFN